MGTSHRVVDLTLAIQLDINLYVHQPDELGY
jgi:hypothetical protein